MQRYNISVDKKRAGKRLDVFLVDKFKERMSRTFIKRLIDKGRVLVNEKAVKVHYLVNDGDRIVVDIPDPEPVNIKPEKIDLDILYEDADIIVVNKPVGLVVHPGAGNPNGTLVNGLLYHCKGLSGIGGVLRPGIVHRLDKDTSGIIVAAKNDISHRFLSEQFKNRTIKRVYIALVKGDVQLDNGIVELPLGRHSQDRKKIGIQFADGKEAATHYRVLGRFEGFTMLELKLETGRTHQIRVHMAHIGHPLVGDKLYGSAKGLSRQALHAKMLGFVHPQTKQFMEFDSEIPADMQGLFKKKKV
ncbi:MAG: RluA family pseudouridine synthase [Candidatus Omnitrophica bacterium]|nr:RluA family pseudouridine synthase [Candidatus Omnitrophota bacterium]